MEKYDNNSNEVEVHHDLGEKKVDFLLDNREFSNA